MIRPKLPPLTKDGQVLVEQWHARHQILYPLVRKLFPTTYRKARALGWGNEDIDAAGWLGIVMAARKYDSKIGKFCTYATLWVRASVTHELIRPCYEPVGGRPMVRGDLPTNQGGSWSDDFWTCIVPAYTKPSDLERWENQDDAKTILGVLAERVEPWDMEIMVRKADGEQERSIAKSFNCSHQSVNVRNKVARAKLVPLVNSLRSKYEDNQ